MKDHATLVLPNGLWITLEDLNLTLGELIALAQEKLSDPKIAPDGFGALKHFFFVNTSTGTLIDENVDLRSRLVSVRIKADQLIELRLCAPKPGPDGTIMNPMRGVKTFIRQA